MEHTSVKLIYTPPSRVLDLSMNKTIYKEKKLLRDLVVFWGFIQQGISTLLFCKFSDIAK